MARHLQHLEGFVGQRDLMRSVEHILIGSARRDVPLPHLLLVGPTGYGKAHTLKEQVFMVLNRARAGHRPRPGPRLQGRRGDPRGAPVHADRGHQPAR